MAKATLADYKGSKGFIDYLRDSKVDKATFEKLPESEQLETLVKYFSENKKRVSKKGVKTETAVSLDELKEYVTLNPDKFGGAEETLKVLQGLYSLDKDVRQIARLEADIEAKQAQLTQLRNSYNEKVAEYKAKLGF